MKQLIRSAAVLLACAAAALAQFDTGSVLGTVRDKTGGAISGAKVTLENLDTGIRATKTTDAEGSYEFPGVRIGRYKVSAEQSGFSKAFANDVTVNVNTRQRVDLELTVGQVSETVEVTGAASILETDSSQRGQVVTALQAVELPLNGRNYSSLVLLTTGVRQSAIGTASISTNREGSFNVNGLRSTFNNFLLDGLDNNAYGTSNQGFSNQVTQPPPDSVAEFQVVTNNMSAEYGRSGGATINVAYKSGTNLLHGDAWEFFRNTDLNATGFFKPRDNRTPPLNRNQFGFDLGGPIAKNRAFFFTDYEGFRQVRKFVTALTLPTAAQRALADQSSITFNAGGQSYTLPVTPFARKVIHDLPANTNTAAASNFITLQSFRDFTDKYNAKFDYLITPKLTGFFRLGQRKANLFDQPPFPGPSGGDGNGYTRILNQSLATGVTYTPTSTQVIEVRFGASRTRAGKFAPFIGGPSVQDAYGIPGLPTDPQLVGGLYTQVVTGFANFGRQATNPQWQYPTVFNPKVNYSRLLGRHSLKAGYEYQRTYTEVEDVNPLYGRDTYNGAFSGSNYTDFLLGLRARYELTNFFITHLRQNMHFLYLQDDFKVNQKLTLNLGIRYEYATPYWAENNVLTNFDPATRSMMQAKDGTIYDRALVDPDRNNWAPRIGFAYSVTPKTVVRSGFGMSYIHFNRAGGGNLLPINGPQVVNAVISQNFLLPNNQLNPAFLTTQQGYPAGIVSPDQFDPLKANITYIPRDYRTSYVMSWFFSVQREIAKNTVLDVAYVGNRADKLLLFANYNQAVPNLPGQNLTLQQRRPISTYSDITYAFNGGWSDYHSLQVRLERRFSAGFQFLNSFTWSKAMDNGPGSLENPNGNFPAPQDFYNLAADKGRSAYDQPFTNITSFVWELPFGKGRKFLGSMPRIADAVLGGWQLTGINTMTSGQPVTLVYSPAAAFVVSGISADFRGANNYRPNVLGEVKVPEGQRTPGFYLDRNMVALPTATSPNPFGNAGRNTIRSDSFYQFDASLAKNFAVTERVRIQLRGEAFNLLNKTNLGAPNSNFSSGAFGTVTSAYDARQLQVGLKLSF
jgi:hypothetical protein